MKMYNKEQIHAIVSGSSHTFVQFSKDVAKIMDIEWSDKFKNRITQCLAPAGTSKFSKEEHEAMSLWCYCHENIAEVAISKKNVERLKPKLQIIIDWLAGKRQINWRDARNLQSFLRSFNYSS